MDMPLAIQAPSAARLRTSGNAEYLPTSPPRNTFTYPTSTTFLYRIIDSLWFDIKAGWRICLKVSLHQFMLWSLFTALLVISCMIEQEPGPTKLRLAICLACAWLVPFNLHIRTLMRTFRDRGRDDFFIVTTAMLSFVFIKAFAILDGYSIAALIRIPICLTLAAWIASHWCNFEAAPDVRFGA